MFSCQHCEIFNNTFFYRTPLVAASASTSISPDFFPTLFTSTYHDPSRLSISIFDVHHSNIWQSNGGNKTQQTWCFSEQQNETMWKKVKM